MPPEQDHEEHAQKVNNQHDLNIARANASLPCPFVKTVLKQKTEDESARLEFSAIIPACFLNPLGFINYDHYGRVPWEKHDKIELPSEFTFPTQYLGIDCEMVGVGHLKDSALARVSIVTSYGVCIYDRFVKPEEEITDFRTDFSGVRPKDLIDAPSKLEVIPEIEKLVDGKILVGHSIHNDLHVLKLTTHMSTRDTAVFFKKKLQQSKTPGLRMLIKKYFNDMDIQTGEHSSILDAQATMKLYIMFCHEWEKNSSEWREKANLHLGDSGVKFDPLQLENITEMHVSPREDDIFMNSKQVFKRGNKVIGAYSSCEEYLDVQFRLLSEDFLIPLRKGVKRIKFKNQPGAVKKSENMYHGVSISGEDKEVKGVRILSVPIERNNLRDVDWEETTVFKNGSLLLLTPDNFKSIKFATVSYRFDVKDRNQYSLQMRVTFSNDVRSWTTTKNDKFSMMESVAFYEAYKHTLEYLQVVKLHEFPMKKYIVDAVTESIPPQYLKNSKAMMDFSVFKNMEDSSNLNFKAYPFDFANWPSALQLGMDPSQYEAFQKALTQEMTIIQGPPGTGKTFIGVQIVKLLLSNLDLLPSPILIVSYTNHALDQTLELILEFLTVTLFGGNEKLAENAVLRIGGGSKSEIIQPLVLKEKELQFREKKKTSKRLDVLKQHLKFIETLEISENQGIIDFQLLPGEIRSELARQCKVVLEMWNKWENQQPMREDPLKWFGIRQLDVSQSTKRPPRGSPLLVSFDGIGSYDETIMPIIYTALSRAEEQFPNPPIDLTKNPKTEDEIYLARWTLYFHIKVHLTKLVKNIKRNFVESAEKLKELEHYMSKGVMLKSAKIIGMTTTGAVKFKKMVENKFKPKIMIVEEAAHVLEAHVVASLTKHCEQMIMIGDHKQLRPLTADYQLAKDFQLDVSLMERLVKNGTAQGKKNWIQLKVQHRMRPEIARLVCPVIYEELDNHPVVYEYPDVKGCEKNLFFLDHKAGEGREAGLCSYFNDHEAKFVLALADHFLAFGYQESQITIIVMYLAQKLLLEKMIQSGQCRGHVRLSSVDGYQGEENDIIIMSLVRSNEQNQVGFLKTDNRVCVALSRARHGLFMIGNMNALKESSETWCQINDILVDGGNIGTKLNLQCSDHNTVFAVKNAEQIADFICRDCVIDRMAAKLESSLNIVDDVVTDDSENDFEAISTIETVVVTLLCGHEKEVDRSLITNMNGVKCEIVVEKKLPCGHSGGTVACHLRNEVEETKCYKIVPINLPCGHTQKFPCHFAALLNDIKTIKCNYMVGTSLSCGHPSGQKIQCHLSNNFNKIEEKCMTKVATVLPCGHASANLIECHLSSTFNGDGEKCQTVVTSALPCGHTQKHHCNLGDKVKCSKLVAPGPRRCGHVVPIECHLKHTDRDLCRANVSFNLPCGHAKELPCHMSVSLEDKKQMKCTTLIPCILPCGHTSATQKIECCQLLGTASTVANTAEEKCREYVSSKLPCGHVRKYECHLQGKVKCNKLIPSVLPCGHKSRQKIECHLRNTVTSYKVKEKCHEYVTSNLPCGHVQKHECHLQNKVKCNTRISSVLPCGHIQNLECHLKALSEDNCDVMVHTTFPCGHTLTHPCHLRKTVCDEKVSSNLPCGHAQKHLCHLRNKVKCNKVISVNLPCGHAKKLECHLKTLGTGTCNKVVSVNLSCGHAKNVECRLKTSCKDKCKKTVMKKLPCGHEQAVPCRQNVDQVQCPAKVQTTLPSCGHHIHVECYMSCGENKLKIKCNAKCRRTCEKGHICQVKHPCYSSTSNCPIIGGNKGCKYCRNSV